MKTHTRVVVRKTGEKQAKTGVLSAEKFFEKIRKNAEKIFFWGVLRADFLRIPPPVPPCHALCPADRQRTDTPVLC